ncbi:MAG TPA: DUF4097 family beta strand repeat-containing protein [Vicinamibacterales bacterium]|nr:DUF4097 family beta strand repeat-containing protein [Vicinamibacterales bacterium]
MKTTATLRILFTLAILAAMAAAPAAQVFTWEPNRQPEVRERVRVSIDRAQAALDRTWERINSQIERRFHAAERTAERARQQAERRASQIERQVRQRVDAQVRRQIQNEMRLNRNLNRYRAYNYGDAQIGSDADPCRDRGYHGRDDDYFQHCEVRESTMPAGMLNVDAGQNGGIHVEAWDRNEIRVRAVVQGSARTEADARALAGQVQVQSSGGRVYATGPESDRRHWWSVSYRINVPRKNDLDLHASNGGITIVGVSGNMRFDTTNGGVRLQDVGGRVNGETRNGGVNVMLNGDRWEGEGLDVETSNGGVTVAIPDGYNAEFETRTVNGGLRIDFPITVQGELTPRRGISTTLGSGGPLVRARTTNGGVKVVRR